MKNNVIEKIKNLRIMPLVTLDKAEHAITLGKALIKANLPIVEVTFRTDSAQEAIKILTEQFPEILVGAGTILNIDMANCAIEAGASFILSPGLDSEVVTYCQRKDVVIMPGCMTPTDLSIAKKLGLKTVKIFPITQIGGLSILKSISAPFGDMNFVATGGINDDNLSQYLSYEKIISCGGSWMIKKERLEKGDVEGIVNDIKNSMNHMLG